MNSIEIKKVQSNKELMQFIKMPWNIYKNDPNWVPPLIMDRKKLLDKKKNPFFQHAEMDLFLAFKDGNIAGRIAAITNENHNKFHEDNVGFFGFFESIDDLEVTKKLFETAESWIKEKGKDGVIGPMSPSSNDEMGLLVDGFDSPPYVLMCHNPEYYIKLIENAGYKKAKDLWAWYIDSETANKNISEKMFRVAEKSTEKFGLTIRNINFKNMDEEVKNLKEVYNNAWSKNWGFVPMTDEEFNHMAADLKQVADPDFIFIVEKDGRPIGFSLTLPNINEVLINIKNGKLFPTGLFKLLFGLKKVKTVRVITLGIIKEYQFGGFSSIMILKSIKTALDKGLQGGEMSWILEDNHAMNSPIESLGSKKHKTYRIYQKQF
jgi:hypothetical protein